MVLPSWLRGGPMVVTYLVGTCWVHDGSVVQSMVGSWCLPPWWVQLCFHDSSVVWSMVGLWRNHGGSVLPRWADGGSAWVHGGSVDMW